MARGHSRRVEVRVTVRLRVKVKHVDEGSGSRLPEQRRRRVTVRLKVKVKHVDEGSGSWQPKQRRCLAEHAARKLHPVERVARPPYEQRALVRHHGARAAA